MHDLNGQYDQDCMRMPLMVVGGVMALSQDHAVRASRMAAAPLEHPFQHSEKLSHQNNHLMAAYIAAVRVSKLSYSDIGTA